MQTIIMSVMKMEIVSGFTFTVSNMKKRIEFLYDKQKDTTNIFVWLGMQIIDKLEMPGILSSYQKRKIRKELLEREE